MAQIAREPLNESWLNDKLTGPQAGFASLVVREESPSTNAELVYALRRDWDAWPDLAILTTQHQSAGTGRMDRVWDSPAQSTLAVSQVLKPRNSKGRPLPTQSYGWFTLIAALALVETLKSSAGIGAEIKWPNDVQVDGKKVSGILAQLVADPTGNPPAVVLGTGINVSQTIDELPVENATSIALAAATATGAAAAINTAPTAAAELAAADATPTADAELAAHSNLTPPATLRREEILVNYLTAFARHYRAFTAVDGDPAAGNPSVLAAVSSHMSTLGAMVDISLPNGETLTGRASSLDVTGALIVLDAAGNPRAISAGDVQRVRPGAAPQPATHPADTKTGETTNAPSATPTPNPDNTPGGRTP